MGCVSLPRHLHAHHPFSPYIMIHLRPYQIQSVELIRQSFRNKHKRIVLTLPTGAGKSVVFTEMVRLSVAHDPSAQVLVLTHRDEIFKSTFRHLDRTGIVPHKIAAGHPNPPPDAKVIVSMVETLSRRFAYARSPILLNPKLIIIDEAHFGNFNKIIDHFPDCHVIGVTATPIGAHFHKYYTDIVANIDIPELIAQKFLVPCKAYHMVSHDFSDVAVSKVTGDYDSESLFNHFNKRNLYEGVIEGYKSHLSTHTRTLVFNVNVEHTIEMTRKFNEAGIVSKCITSLTPQKERERTLTAFHNGEFPVLNNCGILTTGYDEPSITGVIMNRATKSLPLWLQCQGRASRPYEGKECFTVLDYGDNHKYLGLWSEPRKWSLDKPSKRQKKQAAPIKICPNCSAALYASATSCSYCGHEFDAKETELLTGRLEEIKYSKEELRILRLNTIQHLKGRPVASLSVDELIEVQKAGRYSFAFVKRLIHRLGNDAINEYIEKMGYKKTMGYMMRKNPVIKVSDKTVV